MKFITIVEFMEKRYMSKAVGLVASVVIFTGLLIYALSILVGMAKATEVVGGINYDIALIVVVIVTAIYTAIGGYIAQVWTQAIQAIFMLFMAIAICVLSLLRVGGLGELSLRLGSIDPSLAGWPYKEFLPLFSLYLSLGFLGWGNPALVLRFISIRDKVSLRTATIIASIAVAILTLSLNIASAASRVIVSNEIKPDHAFVYLVRNIFPQGFDIVFLIAVLSASMSTITALLSVMAQCVRDIVKLKIRLDNRQEILLYRFTTMIIALLSTILALNPPEMIIILFDVVTSILAGVLVGPIVYGLYWKRITPTAVIVSMIISFSIAIAVSAYKNFSYPWTYYSFIPTIISSIAIPPIVSMFSKPLSKEYIDKIFSKC